MIFALFSFSSDGSETTTVSNVGSAVKSIFSDIWSSLTSIQIEESVNKIEDSVKNVSVGKHILPTSCIFNKNFKCLLFAPNVENGEMLFNFKNSVDEDIVLVSAEISEGIKCGVDENRLIEKNAEFYIKIKNCTLDDVEGKMKLYYHIAGSTSDFTKYSEGTLIVK